MTAVTGPDRGHGTPRAWPTECLAGGTAAPARGLGWILLALTMIGVGILGFARGDFVQIWQPVPKAFPAREVLIYICAVVSILCGAGLLWRRTAASAARVLFFYLLLWMLVFKLRFIFLAPLTEGSYQSNGENAVIVAGAWALYVAVATDWDRKHLRFFGGLSQVEIATEVGLSQVQVLRLIRASLERMRGALGVERPSAAPERSAVSH